MRASAVCVVAAALGVAGCGSSSSSELAAPTRVTPAAAPAAASATGKIVASSTSNQTIGMPTSPLDLGALPLGSGKSSTAPSPGLLYRCGGTPQGGPPVRTPPWVDEADGTWSAKAKQAVRGKVKWKASFTAKHKGSHLVLSGNGLPRQSGTFPVASSDPAYAYNPDPDPVTKHSVKVTLPYNPKVNASAACERAVVGVAIDGIPILDGFDAGGNDAVGVETQDTCHGHPNRNAGYHYHALSPCILPSGSGRFKTRLVGWALDGFGIFVEYDSHHRLITNAKLDGCHGRKSKVPWHGKKRRVYHYVATWEFPYTVGCFRGTETSSSTISPPAGGGPPGGGPPQ